MSWRAKKRTNKERVRGRTEIVVCVCDFGYFVYMKRRLFAVPRVCDMELCCSGAI